LLDQPPLRRHVVDDHDPPVGSPSWVMAVSTSEIGTVEWSDRTRKLCIGRPLRCLGNAERALDRLFDNREQRGNRPVGRIRAGRQQPPGAGFM